MYTTKGVTDIGHIIISRVELHTPVKGHIKIQCI